MTAIKRYRKKPIEIEAVQWDSTDSTSLAIREWVSGNDAVRVLDTDYLREAWDYDLGAYRLANGKTVFAPFGDRCLIVFTLEGEMVAELDDWIIRGVQGEFYPCKPDIFAATYEAVR